MKYLTLALLLLAPLAQAQEPSRLHPSREVRIAEWLDQQKATTLYETAVRFNWSLSAPHHESATVVKAGNSMGSGTYVTFDGHKLILTCRHVVAGSGTAEIRFQDGRRVTGTCTTDKYNHDLAVVVIPPTAGVTVPVAQQVTDARVEILGFGGPRDILRHWYGSRTGLDTAGNVADYSCGVAAGDSGGGVLNMQGEIVGVMTHGTTASDTENIDNWRTHERSGGPYLTPIRSFLGRVVAKIRARQLCPPGG